MATKNDAPKLLDQPPDNWSVPKLLVLMVAVLGSFLVFIYNVSP